MVEVGRTIVIASRRSRLARIQAEHVGGLLEHAHPGVSVRYVTRVSEGDRKGNVPLSESGGKGLFAKAIESMLLSGEADLAVHSMKDLPARDEAGLSVKATPRREDSRDALIARAAESLAGLPRKAVVGTASPRRAAQVLRARPDVRIKLIRGNVETRLSRVLEEGAFDATFLAMAGLKRLDLGEHARPMGLEEMLPASCQAALAVQCRSDDVEMAGLLEAINHGATFAATQAERRIVAALGCTCHSPIGCHVAKVREGYRIRVRLLSEDGRECLEADETCEEAALLERAGVVARQMLEAGAKRLVEGGG